MAKSYNEVKYKAFPNGKWMATAVWRNQRLRPRFDTESEAKVWGKEQELRMAQGLDIEMPQGRVSSVLSSRTMTLEELFNRTRDEHWLGGEGGEAMKSADKLIIAARQAVDAIGPKVKVASLDYDTIEKATAKLQKERGNSIATTNRRKSALSKMFKHGMKLGVITSAPIIEKKRETYRRSFRILPGLEVSMLTFAIARGWLVFYDLLVCGLYLGQRENELLRLRFEENSAHALDGYIDDGFAVFPAQDADNKSTFTHAVPLRAIVEEVIARRRATAKDPRGLVFPGITKRNVDYWFRTMRDHLIEEGHPDILSQQREGLPVGKDFCFHILRHEFCSRLGDAGFMLAEIMQYSGHKTASMCQRYVKPHKVAHRQRLARVPGALIEGLPGGEPPAFAPVSNVVPMKLVAKAEPTVEQTEIEKALAVLKAAGLGDAIQTLMAAARNKADKSFRYDA